MLIKIMRFNILKSFVIFFIFVVFQSATCEPAVVGSMDFDMVFVEGGAFRMGATPEQGDDVSSDERPQHYVTINSYYIGRFEVTQAQWKAVMGVNPSFFKGGDLPVEKVSWNDVQLFIQKLNVLTGKKYRLPTEAEWEYAARGGKRSGGYKFSGSNLIGEVAWYGKNSENTTHKVGTVAFHNELEIYDMSGNVMEWCQDWYGPYRGQSYDNPRGPKRGSCRVVRGGSWCFLDESCRIAKRCNAFPGVRLRDLGFRLAMDAD